MLRMEWEPQDVPRAKRGGEHSVDYTAVVHSRDYVIVSVRSEPPTRTAWCGGFVVDGAAGAGWENYITDWMPASVDVRSTALPKLKPGKGRQVASAGGNIARASYCNIACSTKM